MNNVVACTKLKSQNSHSLYAELPPAARCRRLTDRLISCNASWWSAQLRAKRGAASRHAARRAASSAVHSPLALPLRTQPSTQLEHQAEHQAEHQPSTKGERTSGIAAWWMKSQPDAGTINLRERLDGVTCGRPHTVSGNRCVWKSFGEK